ESVQALADYYESIELALGACLRSETQGNSFAQERSTSPVIDAVVFGSDQGLVGQFNDIVADYAGKRLSKLSKKSRVWAVGERVHACLIDAGIPVFDVFELPSSVKGIAPLVGQILVDSQSHHTADESVHLYLFYNRPRSREAYTPHMQRLLPLDEEWLTRLRERPWPSGRYAQIVGEGTMTLRALINEYLFVSLFRSCAESLASENASRLASMQRATQNIDELLKNLQGDYHRLRKNGIDEELFDVIAAFDSLS
ncbi:MAG: F0F1 ATP synthase subunit gamma, partial [Spirochaetia bacterium]|nr:F0F1 ATP synthase subunit gamma [Spirochaetia bacterium]